MGKNEERLVGLRPKTFSISNFSLKKFVCERSTRSRFNWFLLRKKNTPLSPENNPLPLSPENTPPQTSFSLSIKAKRDSRHDTIYNQIHCLADIKTIITYNSFRQSCSYSKLNNILIRKFNNAFMYFDMM